MRADREGGNFRRYNTAIRCILRSFLSDQCREKRQSGAAGRQIIVHYFPNMAMIARRQTMRTSPR